MAKEYGLTIFTCRLPPVHYHQILQKGIENDNTCKLQRIKINE